MNLTAAVIAASACIERSLNIYLDLFIYFIYSYMKPTHKTTHKTVYTMDIKRHDVCCWLIGNCRDEPLTQRRKSYNSGKGKTQYKKQTRKKLVMITVNI